MRLARSWLFIFAVVLLGVCIYRLVEGVREWQEDRRIEQHYAEELRKLELERDRLKVRVEKLRTNELAKERLARGLGYIKPGEIVYKVVPAAKVPVQKNNGG